MSCTRKRGPPCTGVKGHIRWLGQEIDMSMPDRFIEAIFLGVHGFFFLKLFTQKLAVPVKQDWPLLPPFLGKRKG